MFAIVDIAGFQEKVEKGSVLKVPRLSQAEGEKVTFDHVLLFQKSEKDVRVGAPYVEGVSVDAKVRSHGKGEKIRVYTMKPRSRNRRTIGHRQAYTEVEITSIKG